jgi:hypothetical protein
MPPKDVTVEILRSIRDEARATNSRLDGLAVELVHTRTELGERIDALTRRVVDSEVRTATAIVDLHGTLHEVADLLRAQHDLRPRLERCEQDIGALKRRLKHRPS